MSLDNMGLTSEEGYAESECCGNTEEGTAHCETASRSQHLQAPAEVRLA